MACGVQHMACGVQHKACKPQRPSLSNPDTLATSSMTYWPPASMACKPDPTGWISSLLLQPSLPQVLYPIHLHRHTHAKRRLLKKPSSASDAMLPTLHMLPTLPLVPRPPTGG